MSPSQKSNSDSSELEPFKVERLKIRELKSLKGAGATADPKLTGTADANSCTCTCPDSDILLRWSFVKRLLEHIRNAYPGIALQVSMNTNATLIDDGIAADLASFGVKIAISIDGYRESHDKTRHYHGGGGSFERVVQGVQRYRDATGHELRGFQGTIEDVEHFDNDRFFEMSQLGFDRARLAPNLLKYSADRGAYAAWWEARLAIDSDNKPVKLSSTEFQNILFRLQAGKVGFRFNCGGLSGIRQRVLTLNIDSMQVSQLCSFVSPGSVAAASIGRDIYDVALWRTTRDYLRRRLETLRTSCAGCEVQGACQGSCVYNGLDIDNQRHDASCSYQRALFRHALEFRNSGDIVAPSPQKSGTARSSLNSGAAPRIWPMTVG